MGDTTDDETDTEENTTVNEKEKNQNYLKKLFNKNKNIVSEKQEMMSTYTDENEALFSFKSTFQNDMHTNKGALVHRMKTIETDTTFPSIPAQNETGALTPDSLKPKSSCDTLNTMQAPIPKSHPASIASEDEKSTNRNTKARKYKQSESTSTSIGYEI